MTDFGRFSAASAGSPEEYENYIRKDPYRMGLHYPAVMEQVGDLRKRILDVGTGDGLFPRLLAKLGASVVGYDHNPEMIAKARQLEAMRTLDVKYVKAKPQTFSDEGLFDAATSVMVLPYASDLDDLTAFFASAHRHLVAGGRFISVVLDPSFSTFGAELIVRRISKLEGNEVRMEFLDEVSGAVTMQAVMHQYTRQEYEDAAVEAGMTPEPWRKLFAAPDAVRVKGESFWQACHEHQPYGLFAARKD
jgi:SAM-dependent methyltransferase